MATYRSVDKKPHDNILEKPARLGIVSRMQPYDEMTSTFLTEAMGNVVRNSEKAASKYQKLNSLMFE